MSTVGGASARGRARRARAAPSRAESNPRGFFEGARSHLDAIDAARPINAHTGIIQMEMRAGPEGRGPPRAGAGAQSRTSASTCLR